MKRVSRGLGLGLGLVLAAAAAGALAQPPAPAHSVLVRVPFVSGSDQLGPLARQRLDRAIPALKADYAGSPVEIAGHTDALDSGPMNLDLSRRRARAVYQYLEANGVDLRFMFENGYGEDQPLADNATREGRFRNRRVELRLLRGPGPGELTHR